MTNFVTVTPAYGRDYKSAAAALKDWIADKDFLVQDITNFWDKKPINKSQADAAGYKINIRFNKLKNITAVGV